MVPLFVISMKFIEHKIYNNSVIYTLNRDARIVRNAANNGKVRLFFVIIGYFYNVS